ncbi:MAG: STAS domain-containing protein [Pyrinomonadaceae bacterium]
MQLQTQQLTNGITKIDLAGRMDNAGVQEIDLQFTALTATKKAAVVVDLSDVSFLASIGIRTLMTNARALRQRGGKMVLLNPKPLVEEVLDAAGITTVIETLDDLESAYAALGAPESN